MDTLSLSQVKKQGTRLLKQGNFLDAIEFLITHVSDTSEAMQLLRSCITLYEVYQYQESTGTIHPDFPHPVPLSVLTNGVKELLDSLTDEDLEKDDYPIHHSTDTTPPSQVSG